MPDDVLETDAADPEAWRWVRLNMDHDPLPILRLLDIPLLALFGGADERVPPGENVTLMRQALADAGNRDVRIEVLDGANHGLRPAPSGESLPLHRTTGFAPGRWRLVREWSQRF